MAASAKVPDSALPVSVPDFRNLGTVVRILLIVNGLAFIAAVMREPRLDAISAAWLGTVSIVEPHLLLQMLLLYVFSPQLVKMEYRLAAFCIVGMTLLVALGLELALVRFVDLPTDSLLRHSVLSVLTAAVLLFYFHLRAKALSPAITEARLQALQARIRPHFLFNSINAVLSLMRSEPRRAETALEDLADLFRVIMRDNRQLTALENEVELCRQYLSLEKLRLGERLCVQWHVDKMPADALIPPLILQPLLENAVYHGIEPSSAPGVIAINIFVRRGEVHAILRNPYQLHGRHHSGNKMAIANIRERLALHFDAEASLESKVNQDSYEVHIRMPYRRAVREETSHA